MEVPVCYYRKISNKVGKMRVRGEVKKQKSREE
jgi:hypothetical protein